MNKIPTQIVSLNCPVCGTPIQSEVYSLIDVGLEPELKGHLLRGNINTAHCPKCGGEGLVAVPILYHDPEHELLLAYLPPEMQLQDDERQRIIGDLTNLILSYLPPEQRKGYLLMPKILLSYQSLLERILEAEGITPEMMEAQQERMDLMQRLLQAMEDEQALAALVEEEDERLDFEFFATLGAYIEANRQDGLENTARRLEGLREKLLELSSYGRKFAAQMLAGTPDHPPLTREELLEELQAAESEEALGELVTWYRAGVDYGFFQMLTERMEAHEQAGEMEQAQRLGQLRENLLELTARLDEETRTALAQAAELLQQLLNSESPEDFIREHLEQFDDAFFIVLGANLQAAEEAGQQEAQQRLQELGNQILEIAQENLPPQVRLLRDLLSAESQEAIKEMLEEQEDWVDENLLALMQSLAQEVADKETADRLGRLAEWTKSWLEQRD
ncbi:MAG: hypothetical protein JXA37_06740 [Chloroflexia bacterium]|nr:hypothetical protein [Chloroflexia bacterium]